VTGRIEFQNDSWDHVGPLDRRLDRLNAGNKAALSIRSKSDVDLAVRAARTEIDRRGGG
jgi:hypothetical protein